MLVSDWFCLDQGTMTRYSLGPLPWRRGIAEHVAGHGGKSMSGQIRLRAERAGQRARPRWLVWLRRWSLQVVCFFAILPVFALIPRDASLDYGNLWAEATLPLMLTAFTAHLWRRHRPEDLPALAFRIRHRRICWRISLVLLYCALIALWVASYWYWRSSNAVSDGAARHYLSQVSTFRHVQNWLFATASIPTLVEPLAWRMWPYSLRDAARRAKSAERSVREHTAATNKFQGGFDFELGAAGRPVPLMSSPAGEPSPESVIIRPSASNTRYLNTRELAKIDEWWRNGTVSWNGSALVVTDAHGAAWKAPTADEADSAQVAEIVCYEERFSRSTYSNLGTKLRSSGLLFLNERGRRIAQISAVGLAIEDVGRVAKAAGIPFAAYDLGGRSDDLPPRLSTRLFPKHRRMVKLSVR